MIESVQAAIFSKINAIVGLNVFGYVPQDETDYPYVVVGTLRLENADTETELGYDCFFRVHTWSVQKSSKETIGIQKQIYDAMHLATDLTPSGYSVIGVYQTFSEIMLENDGITRHGVQQFRIQFEPTPAP